MGMTITIKRMILFFISDPINWFMRTKVVKKLNTAYLFRHFYIIFLCISFGFHYLCPHD